MHDFSSPSRPAGPSAEMAGTGVAARTHDVASPDAEPAFGTRLLTGAFAWSLAFAALVVVLGSLGAAAR